MQWINRVKEGDKNQWYVLLLPLFFVLHGYVEYYELIYFKHIPLLFFQYLGATLVLWILFSLVYKSSTKGAVFTFLLLCFYFFFGALHDQSKAWFDNLFFTRYRFIVPVSLMFFVLFFMWIRNARLQQFRRYLTLLMLLFLAIDLVALVSKLEWFGQNRKLSQLELNACDTCARPDIYLIVADEYAGESQLREVAGFDNSPFYNALRERGFHIVENSLSNYNSTPFSVASMLDMNYLQGIVGESDSKEDIIFCSAVIKRCMVASVFESMGYEMINNSLFNFADKSTDAETSLFPIHADIISKQTFLSRLIRDVLPGLIVKFNLYNIFQTQKYTELKQNRRTINQLKQEVNKKKSKPRLIYTHLMMPHHPFYFDKNGRQIKNLNKEIKDSAFQRMYLDYLQYSNTIFIGLFDYIQNKSQRPYIILFVSDHGFRMNDNMILKYQYYNINAVLLPSRSYKAFYHGMSNVNLFRVLLNESFGQRLPLLKDSTVYILPNRFVSQF